MFSSCVLWKGNSDRSCSETFVVVRAIASGDEVGHGVASDLLDHPGEAIYLCRVFLGDYILRFDLRRPEKPPKIHNHQCKGARGNIETKKSY